MKCRIADTGVYVIKRDDRPKKAVIMKTKRLGLAISSTRSEPVLNKVGIGVLFVLVSSFSYFFLATGTCARLSSSLSILVHDVKQFFRIVSNGMIMWRHETRVFVLCTLTCTKTRRWPIFCTENFRRWNHKAYTRNLQNAKSQKIKVRVYWKVRPTEGEGRIAYADTAASGLPTHATAVPRPN